ncbi:hypothetical protein [Elizabethkingia phage TCUEAP1]|nr:hypothetical protein [Elizabethkingia phage TCUEAP1]
MKFNLQNFLSKTDLVTNELAVALFPKNGHPIAAFNRLKDGASNLTVNQLEIIAEMAGVTVPDLYEPEIKMSSDPSGLLTLKSGDTVAYLDRDHWTLTVGEDVIFLEWNITLKNVINIIKNISK